MRRHTRLRLIACFCAVAFSLAAYLRMDASTAMAAAASNFTAALTPDQAAKAKFTFADDERLNWHFIPRERKGLPLREMTPAQRHLAYALLSSGLSPQGFAKAASVMSLEEVLRILENDSGERRNPEKYYFSIFGEPSAKGIWGFRVEGHHLSLNYTIAGGRVTGSPNFFGSNPAEVRDGPRKGLRVLGAEEDLGRELMAALTAEQKRAAIVSAKAYPDILTAANREATLTGQPAGLTASKMTPRQRTLLMAIVSEYANNMPAEMAEARLALVRRAGDNLHFAWAGVEDRGGPHYYRILSPEFLIEYDNTQNNNNHIHSVWREFKGDWGRDLLAEHYKSSHR